jgi:hypothetical protein
VPRKVGWTHLDAAASEAGSIRSTALDLWHACFSRLAQLLARARQSNDSWRPSTGERSVLVLLPLGLSPASVEILPAPGLLLEPMRLTLPVGAAVMLDGSMRWRLPPAAQAEANDPLARALILFEYAPPRQPRATEGWDYWREEVRAAAVEGVLAAAAAAACFGAGVMEVRLHEDARGEGEESAESPYAES